MSSLTALSLFPSNLSLFFINLSTVYFLSSSLHSPNKSPNEAITSSRDAMDFISPTFNASPSKNAPPVSSQSQIFVPTMQPVPLDQDPSELEWRNYSTESQLEAIFTEKSNFAYNEMHVGEVTGTKPVSSEADPVNVIRAIMPNPAPEKEEKLEKQVQSEEVEVENPGMDSRSEEEVELYSNEEVVLKSDDQVDLILLHELMHQIYDLQIEVKERREWAHEKALQAAKKVSNAFLELRTLRMEREIKERRKKENKAKEDEIVKMKAELEEEMKRTEGKAERAQMEFRQLERENREMRAEIEAARLETSEANSKCKRLFKRLKQINKSAEMRERQMLVLQGEVEEAKKVNAEIEEQIDVIRKEISVSEDKLEEEKKLKEQVVKLIEAESKAIISAKNSTRTRHTILTQKLNLDRRRHSEQVKALEREISHLTKDTSSLESVCWPCIFCEAAEASVVILPCGHQVLCAQCGKDHEDIGSEKCPCCGVKVEERIFVYGLGA